MTAIDELLSEYIRMRQNGLDANEVLRTLRHYIEPLPQAERRRLAQVLRGWESNKIEAPSYHQPPVPDTSPLTTQAKQDEIWLQCPNCNRKNRARDVFCYYCGRILEDLGLHDTRTFKSATDELYNDRYFGCDSLLILQVVDSETRFEVRPQHRHAEMVIGRSSADPTVRPDIDLTTANGAELGVSRLHLAIAYDEETNTIQINDLGSANGSFVNGQKLHPSERRILRNGDELKLGRLVMKIMFHHPGEEIP